jgi:hypothetical protein
LLPGLRGWSERRLPRGWGGRLLSRPSRQGARCLGWGAYVAGVLLAVPPVQDWLPGRIRVPPGRLLIAHDDSLPRRSLPAALSRFGDAAEATEVHHGCEPDIPLKPGCVRRQRGASSESSRVMASAQLVSFAGAVL